MIDLRYNSRGFVYANDVQCTYGSTVSLSESSAASGPHVWLRVRSDLDILSEQGLGDGIAHLSLRQAVQVRDNLDKLIQYAMPNWDPDQ